MPKAKKDESQNSQEITDVLEDRFKDEQGNHKVRRIFMSGDTKIGEEVVND